MVIRNACCRYICRFFCVSFTQLLNAMMEVFRSSCVFLNNYFCRLFCSKLMNNKLVTFPSRTLQNQNPLELWVCCVFSFKKIKRSEKLYLTIKPEFLWVSSRQAAAKVTFTPIEWERWFSLSKRVWTSKRQNPKDIFLMIET